MLFNVGILVIVIVLDDGFGKTTILFSSNVSFCELRVLS